MNTALTSDAAILERIERFCVEQSIGETTFGRSAIGDPNLVSNLRNGRSLTLKTAARVIGFMDEFRAGETPEPRAA